MPDISDIKTTQTLDIIQESQEKRQSDDVVYKQLVLQQLNSLGQTSQQVGQNNPADQEDKGLGSSQGAPAPSPSVNNSNVQSSSPPKSSGKKFDPDAAMNAALNEQVGSIFELADLSLSMSALSSTMETTAVANGTSTVALWSALLNAQGLFCNSSNFNILKEWAQSPLPKTAANFDAFLKGLGGNAEATLFNSVYNDPNLTAADKDNFAQTIVNWYNSANGNLQEFQGNTSTVAQQLNSQTTNLQGWQSIDSALKPTQEQDASQQLIAELSSEADLFGDIVVK